MKTYDELKEEIELLKKHIIYQTELLQRCWDVFSETIGKISVVIDDADMSPDRLYSMSEAINDDQIASKLRKDLFNAGIKM